MAESSVLPTLQWGIIATGMIASWFVSDLTLPRPSRVANHKITAIGSSTSAKAALFVKTFVPNLKPAPICYGSYEAVFADPNVNIVYIATPHAQHASLCLAAISAGKHVLCEKAFALNAREAGAVVAAARSKGVFVMEAMWLRFTPLVAKFQDLLHEEKIIGQALRVFCDFGLNMPINDLPKESRLRDPALGAGSLLDIGIYSLTWGILALEDPVWTLGKKIEEKEQPVLVSQQVLEGGVDVASSIIMRYPSTGQQGILTSSMLVKTEEEFCRVEGTQGRMVIYGSASMPTRISVELLGEGEGKDMGDRVEETVEREKKVYEFNGEGGKGFFYEADAVAIDIANGRTESKIMPLDETMRIMRMMDGIRKLGGAKFPQDDEH